jgi:hypothetical protein
LEPGCRKKTSSGSWSGCLTGIRSSCWIA